MAKSKIQDLSVLKDLLKDNALGLSLIDKAIFMEKTLQDLQKEIDENGVLTEMCQGAYNIERANPALQAYNVTIKNYTTVVKQLNDMLPKKNDSEQNSFKDF